MILRSKVARHAVLRSMAAPVLLSIVLGLGSSCGRSGAESAQAQKSEVPANVRVLTLETSDLPEYLVLSGPASPLHGTQLSAEEGGRVESIERNKGEEAKRGDIVILQDRALLEADMKAQAASRDLSEFNVNRMKELFENNAISEIEYLQAETEFRRSEAMAEVARLRYERAAIKAPFDCLVTERFVEPGQLIAPGTPVARIVNPYVLKLESSVTEREIALVEAGQKAQVIFDAGGSGAGVVHWVSFEADPLTGKFPLEIRIDNHELRFHPGVIARARVLKALHRDVVAIPRDAVVQKGEGPVAFVVEGERARLRELVLGPDQGLMVMVESGLNPGERLVVRGQREIHDGSLVAVVEETSSEDGSLPSDPGVVSRAGAEQSGWDSEPAEGAGR